MRRVQSTLFALYAASSAVYADTTLNLTQGVSPISHDVYELHMTVFWICVLIGIAVFGMMFYAMIFHRKSKGAASLLFSGDFWAGAMAVKLGLADGLGNLMDVMDKEFKTTHYKEFGGTPGLLRLLSGQLNSTFDSLLYVHF